MGNCQAVDAAALVIQHPDGKIERMYWPVSAREVMKLNPGHYVSLIIPLPEPQADKLPHKATVRFTRVKLLRPNDTLALGHAYRLITSQEVMKVLRAKKHAKMDRQHPESVETKHKPPQQHPPRGCTEGNPEMENNQAVKHQRQRARTASSPHPMAARSKSWRPSLQSISEFGS